MPDKPLDPVEWELVRADIAMEKARLKANGDWAKWEEFQNPVERHARRLLLRPAAGSARSAPSADDRGRSRRIVVGESEPRSYPEHGRLEGPGVAAGRSTGDSGDGALGRRHRGPEPAGAEMIPRARPAREAHGAHLHAA